MCQKFPLRCLVNDCILSSSEPRKLFWALPNQFLLSSTISSICSLWSWPFIPLHRLLSSHCMLLPSLSITLSPLWLTVYECCHYVNTNNATTVCVYSYHRWKVRSAYLKERHIFPVTWPTAVVCTPIIASAQHWSVGGLPDFAVCWWKMRGRREDVKPTLEAPHLPPTSLSMFHFHPLTIPLNAAS